MTRHFLTLYLSIVIVLAAVSWGQERLWQSYGGGAAERVAASERARDSRSDSCKQCRASSARSFVADAARDTGLDLELLEPQDVAGAAAIAGLANGKPVLMDGADGRAWVLQRLEQDDRVLAFRFDESSRSEVCPTGSWRSCSMPRSRWSS